MIPDTTTEVDAMDVIAALREQLAERDYALAIAKATITRLQRAGE